MRNRSSFRLTLVAGLVIGAAMAWGPAAQAQDLPQDVRAVDKNAPGGPGVPGTTWANAFTTLQDALQAVEDDLDVTEIWVAAETYKPDEGGGIEPGDKAASFSMREGLFVYGGFLGNAHAQGGETELSERDPETNVTTLSGEINQPNILLDNSLHVVVSVDVDIEVPHGINGFTISHGYFSRGSVLGGGGIFISNSNPQVLRCRFRDNRGRFGGAAHVRGGSQPKFVNCKFFNNSTAPFIDPEGHGGAIYTEGSQTTLINCALFFNSAVLNGGGIMGDASAEDNFLTLINCTFFLNSAGGQGGGLSITTNNHATITNCIFWANNDDGSDSSSEIGVFKNAVATITYSDIEDAKPGEGNIQLDPMFTFEWPDVVTLQPGSPCIDAGSDAAVPSDSFDIDDDLDTDEPLPWDLAKQLRRADGGTDCVIDVDMGAYEYIRPCPEDLNNDLMVDSADLAILLGAWGPNPDHCADLNGDGEVGPFDLALLLGAWGPCPINAEWNGGDRSAGTRIAMGGGEGCPMLEEALQLMGYSSTEEFIAWLVTSFPDQAYRAGQLLLLILAWLGC
ncbi:MAG: right-handed parallel beta-helix repeat-containing protein [Planctomycetota bacterium]|nr:right-handed parallel beta-helix repeat-containing protein [Planctomycetota bacterium]